MLKDDSMNGKISLAVTLAFIIALSSFIPFYEEYRVPNVWEIDDDPFFQKISQIKNEKLFIVGGSAVGQLNSTYINKVISDKFSNYAIYNLSYNADLPTQRLNSLESTIFTNPKIVFYGISYWSLSDYYNIGNSNDPLQSLFKNNFEINPKATTLNAFRTILGNYVELFPNQKHISDTTPFFPYSKDQMKINEESKFSLDIETTIKKVHQNPSNSEQLIALQDTIEILQKNKVKVVIFTVPLHQSYLDIVPENDKILFSETLENLSQKYGVKIYDFANSYSNQNIWNDSYHVALNQNSLVYSEDISQMIIEEVT
tara:strand:+ start:89 stop:1030 length:942 start_codon:yes stop_codon:yes gene_type:complete